LSYVIQNFHFLNKSIQFTPRLRFLVIFNNIELLFFFFRTYLFLFFTDRMNFFSTNILFQFIKYFFSNQLMRILNKLNVEFIGFYDNNLFKSSIFGSFYNVLTFLKPNKTLTPMKSSADFTNLKYVHNLYFFSIKVINVQINKKIFKNFFFYLMFFSVTYWYQHTLFFKFYFNFVIVNPALLVTPSYNGYFLHIYNF